MKKNRITIALYICIGAAFVGLLLFGLWKLKTGVESNFGATKVCHGIEDGVASTLQAVSEEKQIVGKIYRCGKVLGPFPDVNNEIVYTIRGNYNETMTTVMLADSLNQVLSEEGWKQEKTKNGNGRQTFTHTREQTGSGQLQAAVDIISPKYLLFNLRVRTAETYQTQSNDSSELNDIVPSADLHQEYASFVRMKPTYAPAGAKWSRYDGLAWQKNKPPEPEMYPLTNVNSYRLETQAKAAQFYRLNQKLYEADNDAHMATLRLYEFRATLSSGELYTKSSMTQGVSYLLKRNDSLITLEWSGFKMPPDSSKLTDEDAIQIFNSLIYLSQKTL